MIKFLVDSGSDYDVKEAEEKGICFAPLSITFGEETFLDGIELQRREFYDRLVNQDQFPKTAQPSPETFLKFFNEAKENGDEIIGVMLSSEISGTYQSANIAKQMCDYDGIHLIDSLSAIYCIKIMVDYGLKLRDEGKSAKEIVEELTSLKGRLNVLLAVDTLDNLYKGGRLTKMEAGIGNLAKLKPIISIPEGKVIMLKKCIGRKKAMAGLIELYQNIDLDERFPVYAVYTYDENNMKTMIDKFSESGIEIKNYYEMGPTIGTHVGSGSFGIVCVGDRNY
ncbi:MAG: DegV family protein [Eubacterium sp.]|nr:DegV family protein [Eubacterium sp.]